jgi:hypothetical protein
VTWESIQIFLFSAAVDVGAVLFTRSVQMKRMLVGVLTTAMIAFLNWSSILLVTKHDDSLVTASVLGHAFGFVVGMLIPIRDAMEDDVCRRCHPTTKQ